MPLSRWLLPLVAVLALLGQAATAYAAAGIVGSLRCCCPDPAYCKCDHDTKAPKSPVMKPCGSGQADVVPPAVQLAIEPTVEVAIVARPAQSVVHVVTQLPEDRPIEIEKPPF